MSDMEEEPFDPRNPPPWLGSIDEIVEWRAAHASKHISFPSETRQGPDWRGIADEFKRAWDDSWAAQKAIDAMLAGIYEDAGKPYGEGLEAQQRWFKEHADDIRAWCKYGVVGGWQKSTVEKEVLQRNIAAFQEQIRELERAIAEKEAYGEQEKNT